VKECVEETEREMILHENRNSEERKGERRLKDETERKENESYGGLMYAEVVAGEIFFLDVYKRRRLHEH
ncbi:hypothetical protein, partial [Escherichia coli]|uniref:hypothetical protein n=1 Tax=Escherichia coli TaxID=562 RepID=UPI000D45AB55